MKKNNRTFSAVVITMMTLNLLIVGCVTNTTTDDGTVATERQECFLKHFTHLRENDCDLVITADLPVKGAKTVIDSITVFLNEQLYEYFDKGEDGFRLPYETVFSADIPHLLEHYRDAYSPYFDADSTHICEFATHCLELNMVAQTATYITYEINNVFFGEGIEEARSWVTFAKADGHRLRSVISPENLVRFFQEHPEQRNSDIWNDIQSKTENNESLRVFNVGLLNDSLAFQYVWTTGAYDDSKYDLTTLRPYLSTEAQELINANGQ